MNQNIDVNFVNAQGCIIDRQKLSFQSVKGNIKVVQTEFVRVTFLRFDKPN